MDRSGVIARLDALCKVAEARIPSPLPAGVSCAAVMWMTDAEVTELHTLRLALPSAGLEAEQARQRIAAKRTNRSNACNPSS